MLFDRKTIYVPLVDKIDRLIKFIKNEQNEQNNFKRRGTKNSSNF